LLLIRTKTSQKSQENAGCSSPSLRTLLMKLWADLEHMPARSRTSFI
jgi:ppGpp synthetase/RelA/SpoT-type nucleotidyltranferase